MTAKLAAQDTRLAALDDETFGSILAGEEHREREIAFFGPIEADESGEIIDGRQKSA